MDFGVLSGGQTGVDQGAYDAALKFSGAKPEDQPEAPPPSDEALEPEAYDTHATENIQSADATVIIYDNILKGNAARLVQLCINEEKPFKLIDAETVDAEQASWILHRFVMTSGFKSINISGPLETEWVLGRNYTERAISALLDMLKDNKKS